MELVRRYMPECGLEWSSKKSFSENQDLSVMNLIPDHA